MNAARAQLIADEVTAFSAAGEDLEVVVAHSTDTEIRVFEGEVESLVASSTAGVGIKVVSNGRVGFAHCASLDRADIMATLDAARDNARYSSPDEHAGIVVFDGVEPLLILGQSQTSPR